MDAISMCGGATMSMSSATMSMAGMPMRGQSWLGGAASFLDMWTVMMAAMMLPSLVPKLWRYGQAVSGAGESSSVLLTLAFGAGYFLVWTLLGAAVYPAACGIEALTTRYPPLPGTVPIAIGLVILVAGSLQFTKWKARVLARCRAECSRESHGRADASENLTSAWRHGMRLGLQCAQCCAGITAALLVTGMMDWSVMFAATGAITLERLAPAGERVARVIGVVMVGAGCFLILRAGRLG